MVPSCAAVAPPRRVATLVGLLTVKGKGRGVVPCRSAGPGTSPLCAKVVVTPGADSAHSRVAVTACAEQSWSSNARQERPGGEAGVTGRGSAQQDSR